MKINALKLGLAGGIVFGSTCIVMGLLSKTGYGFLFFEVLASIYPGYSSSIVGVFFGGIAGFADVFTGLFILATLYNKFEE